MMTKFETRKEHINLGDLGLVIDNLYKEATGSNAYILDLLVDLYRDIETGSDSIPNDIAETLYCLAKELGKEQARAASGN